MANRQWHIGEGEEVHITSLKLKLTKYVLKHNFENAEMLSHRTIVEPRII